MRATRDNGRCGKSGVYMAGHNDRSFDTENADHIDSDRTCLNVYWDCYQGLNVPDKDGNRPERKYNFEQVEIAYYAQQFGDSIEAQNERHMQSRHNERIRSVEQIHADKKTCPEETVYQLGTKDGYEDPALFVTVVNELFEEMEKRYGSNLQILNWSLHMDEQTPHIHERHVFFADDGYGMNFPKQEKACEALGFELPDPGKKQGKMNNRKMSFDAELRNLYIEIAEKHGVTIEKVPLEGKVHMEKNDYIIAKQNEEIASNQAKLDELTLKISDIDSMADEVAEKAYEKACEVVADTVQEETIKADIRIVNAYRDRLISPDHPGPEEKKTFAGKILGEAMKLLTRQTVSLMENVKKLLGSPEIREKNQAEIAKTARESIKDRLARGKAKADQENKARWQTESMLGVQRKAERRDL